jgi:hypothetical protein
MPALAAGYAPSPSQATVNLVRAFSDENGPITGYAVIVSEDKSLAAADATMPSWKQARASGSVKYYQVWMDWVCVFDAKRN